jgi:signal transduction histidine kinase
MKLSVVECRPVLSAPTIAIAEVSGHYGEVVSHQISTSVLQNNDEQHRRIARELHDSASQNLVAVLMNIALLANNDSIDARSQALLDECVSLVEQSAAEIRAISYELYPPALDELGLSAAVESAAHRFQAATGIATRVNVSEQIGRFDRSIEIAMFRVIEEALALVRRCPHAREARIAVFFEACELAVSVSHHDHGSGISAFDSSVGLAPTTLVGLAARLREIDGTIEISRNRFGTRVTARVPLSRDLARQMQAV